jgi:hypothetical protein
MRSHLFGSDNRQESGQTSSAGGAGFFIFLLTLFGLYKFFKPHLMPHAEKFLEGREWLNCPNCGRLNRAAEICRCKG